MPHCTYSLFWCWEAFKILQSKNFRGGNVIYSCNHNHPSYIQILKNIFINMLPNNMYTKKNQFLKWQQILRHHLFKRMPYPHIRNCCPKLYPMFPCSSNCPQTKQRTLYSPHLSMHKLHGLLLIYAS